MFKDLWSTEVARLRINVTEPYDVRRWADRFGALLGHSEKPSTPSAMSQVTCNDISSTLFRR